jgi:Tfp pilus assembly protein PilX
MLLIAVTLLVMFASRVALLDQRTSANEYRHGQAFAKAEAGLEQAAAFLRANPILHQPDELAGWAACEPVMGFPVMILCDHGIWYHHEWSR